MNPKVNIFDNLFFNFFVDFLDVFSEQFLDIFLDLLDLKITTKFGLKCINGIKEFELYFRRFSAPLRYVESQCGSQPVLKTTNHHKQRSWRAMLGGYP